MFDPGARMTNRTMPKPAGPVIGPGARSRSNSPFNMANYELMNSKSPASGFGFGGVRRLDPFNSR
jgi:hypothetical protein